MSSSRNRARLATNARRAGLDLFNRAVALKRIESTGSRHWATVEFGCPASPTSGVCVCTIDCWASLWETKGGAPHLNLWGCVATSMLCDATWLARTIYRRRQPTGRTRTRALQ